jgi:hypothetical protein
LAAEQKLVSSSEGTMRSRIAKLLGEGINATNVASACGVTLAYVSQLLTESEFAKEVAQLKIGNLQAATTRDRKYDGIEDTLLEKLEDSIQFMIKPREILGAISVINNAKRRGATAGAGDTDFNGAQVVKLQVPQVVINQFMLNSKNEVIEVAGRALQTMSARNLMRTLGELNAEDAAGIIEGIVECVVESEISVDDL